MACGFCKGKRRLASHPTKLTWIKEFDPVLHILFHMYACAYYSHAHIVDVVPPLRCEHFHIRHKFFPVRQENGWKRKRLRKRKRGINNLWGKKKQINLLSILLVLWINISRSKSLVMLTCIPWNSLNDVMLSSVFLTKFLIVFFRTTYGLHRSEIPSARAFYYS